MEFMAGELQTEGISDLLVILGAAGIVIPAFARLRITPIIGFILVGIMVGPMGLGSLVPLYTMLNWVTITNPEAIHPIGEYGMVLFYYCSPLVLSYPFVDYGKCGVWCSASVQRSYLALA